MIISNIEKEVKRLKEEITNIQTQDKIENDIIKFINTPINSDITVADLEYIFENIICTSLEHLRSDCQENIIKALFSISIGEHNFIKKLIIYIISNSEINYAKLTALKIISENNKALECILFDKTIDMDMIKAINSKNSLIQSAYGYYEIYAKIMYFTIIKDKNRCIEFLRSLNFENQNGSALAEAIFRAVLDKIENDNTEVSKNFLQCLVHSFSVDYFQGLDLDENYSEKILKTLNAYFESPGNSCFVSEVIKSENLQEHVKMTSFLSMPFLGFSVFSWAMLSDKLTFCRMMYWFGTKHDKKDIRELTLLKVKEDGDLYKLLEILENISRYYELSDQNECKILYGFITEKLVLASRVFGPQSLQQFSNTIIRLFSPVLDVDKDLLKKILSTKRKVGNFSSGLEAVLDIYERRFPGEKLADWKAHLLSDDILFIHSFIFYSIDEYQQWFVEDNPDHADYIKEKFSKINERKEELKNLSVLADLGFKLIQNNQLAALICATDPKDDVKNIFMKIGTGQGKSLIAALTALDYAVKGKKVLIVTCYASLAKRDYEKFEKLFDHKNIKSQLISSEKKTNDARVIFTDLKTYFNALLDSVREKIEKKEQNYKNENDFNFFDLDVLILDEADSLLDDAHSFGNTVYNYKNILGLPQVLDDYFENSMLFKEKVFSSYQCASFLNRLKENDLFPIYENWFNKIKLQTNKRKTDYDHLGVQYSYIGGARSELTDGNCYIHSMYICVLSFLSSETYSRVIGFSGTIDVKSFKNYSKLYSKSHFFNISPFYGKVDKKTRITYTLPDAVDKNKWGEFIYNDIKTAMSKQQPVLIFADIKCKEEWKAVKKIIENILGEKSYQIIDNEEKVNESSLSKACCPSMVTLASHVVGRGADFVLSRQVIACGGLHVLITYTPMHKGFVDDKMITQMLGRSGRMGQVGSESIITKNAAINSTKNSELTIHDYHENYYLLMKEVYFLIKNSDQQEVWNNWLLFNLFIHESVDYPYQHLPKDIKDAAKFLVMNIIYSSNHAIPDGPISSSSAPEEKEDLSIDSSFELSLRSSFSNKENNEQVQEVSSVILAVRLDFLRKVVCAIKGINIIIAIWLVLFYTLYKYVIYLDFIKDGENDDMISDCVFSSETFLLPYKSCALSDMFQVNVNNSSHLIFDNPSCLPSYLAGAEVYLRDYNYQKHMQRDASFFTFFSVESSMQCFVNLYLTFCVIPVLLSLEKQAQENKDKFNNSSIDLRVFLKNAAFVFLQYFFVSDAISFGTINQVIEEERCDSLYSVNHNLYNAIIIAFSVLLGASFLSSVSLASGLIKKNERDLFIDKVNIVSKIALIASGVSVFFYNTYISNDLAVRFPKSLFHAEAFFYSGGISKIISLLMLIESFVCTFNLYFFPKKLLTSFGIFGSRYELLSNKNIDMRDLNHDLEGGSFTL